MSRPLDFDREGRNWPHREASRFVTAAGLRFHVQIVGEGPPLLMLHGTGASTHSFRDMAPLLAADHELVMVDLPGHGFSGPVAGRAPSMPAMADALAALLGRLERAPVYAIGHSAGAAILLRMALSSQIAPRRIVSFNGALLPFPGLAAQLFPQLAKLLFLNPIAPRFFSWRARSGTAVQRLMDSTGSTLSAEGVAFYERLLASSAHVDGALKMMANWDLETLRRDLTRLDTPLTLVVGTRDLAIPPEVSHRVARIVPSAEIVSLDGLGHLAHEEAPERAAQVLRAVFETEAASGV